MLLSIYLWNAVCKHLLWCSGGSVFYFSQFSAFWSVCTCLIFTRFWFVPVLYISWVVIYDCKTPKSGGRRLEFMRRLKVWKYYRDYFPISLQKTADLDPNENYIIGYHPHGIISCGAFCNFGTEATGFSKLFPGIKCFLMTLNAQFYWPFLRGYILACGKQPKVYFFIWIYLLTTNNSSRKFSRCAID